MEGPVLIETSRGPISLEELVSLMSGAVALVLAQKIVPHLEESTRAYAAQMIKEQQGIAVEAVFKSRDAFLTRLFPDYPLSGDRSLKARWFNMNGMKGYGSYLVRRGVDPIHLLIFDQHAFASMHGLRTDRAWQHIQNFRIQFSAQVALLGESELDNKFLHQRRR